MGRQAGPNKPTYDELKTMYIDQGMTKAQIAKKLGCSVHTVNSWRARYGLRRTEDKPRDPKRVAWLDEHGEAIARPEHTPKAKPDEAKQIVLNPRKGRRKAHPLATPATPAQLAEAKAILANIKSETVAADQLLLRQAVKQFRTWLQWRKEKVTP